MLRVSGKSFWRKDRKGSPRDPDINRNETVSRQAKQKDQPELERKPGSKMTIYLSCMNSESVGGGQVKGFEEMRNTERSSKKGALF